MRRNTNIKSATIINGRRILEVTFNLKTEKGFKLDVNRVTNLNRQEYHSQHTIHHLRWFDVQAQ